MNLKSPVPALLRTRSDLARMMGLPPKARRKEISSAFGSATRCDVWLHIEEEAVVERRVERWTVRVTRATPRCRLEFREDARGPWIQDASEVPRDVLAHFEAVPDRDGRIVSQRSWKTWEKCRWLKDGRRLKGRTGEVVAIVDVPDVARPTGELRENIVLEPLCIDDPVQSRPVTLSLPINPRRILDVVEDFRARAYASAA